MKATEPRKAQLANAHAQLRGPLLAGYALIFALIGGFGGYAAAINIAGAVVAPGQVVAETGAKPVQHPEGGVIAEILVSDGDLVEENAVLVRLDDVQTKSNLGVIAEQLVKQRAILARLKAERDLVQVLAIPDGQNESEKAAIAAELAQFDTRKRNLIVERSIIEQRITQFEQAIQGYDADMQAIVETHRIAMSEYTSLKPLIDRGVVPVTKGLTLEREIAGLAGRKGQRIADIAKTRDQISESRLQLLKIDGDFRSQVLKEIAEAEAQIRELTEKQLVAIDKLKRVEIRSPQTGIVQSMAIFSAGGVVRPSDTIMAIVPKDDPLVIDARVAAAQIDQVRVGQDAMVRLTNFNRRLTPELAAEVELVSADLINPGATQPVNARNGAANPAPSGEPYYAVRLQIKPGELKKLEGAGLLPGMQVQTLISTEARSMLSYLFKPLTDRMALAFRER